MSVRKIIEELAKITALTDESDLNGLVDLQEKFKLLGKESLTGDLSAIIELSEKASGLIDQIVFRETEDTQSAFDLTKHDLVDQAGSLF